LSSKINALARANTKILRVTIGNWTIISNLYYFKKIIIPTMEKKKQIKKFIIILVALVVLGASYGTYKYMHSLAHEETDDAQIEKI
jgi:uncharacterized membrane protein YczE